MAHQVHKWDATSYSKSCQFVASHGAHLIALLDVGQRDKVLDLGCGSGDLTQELVATGANVIGVDASPDMVAAAQARGLEARVMNGHELEFKDEFDAVFSNAALHWMTDCDAVLEGIARALKPGGVCVAEMGGHGNIAAVHGVMRACLHARGHEAPEPWVFPTPEAYQARLVKQGFRVDMIELIPRPTRIDTSLREWLHILAVPFIKRLLESEQKDFVDEVCKCLEPVLQTPDGGWILDYVRLRFRATWVG